MAEHPIPFRSDQEARLAVFAANHVVKRMAGWST
jgi:hypothetical protein